MKKIVFVTAICISLFGCQIKEEIHLNKDSSGSINFYVDMSQMISALGSFGKENSKTSIEQNLDTIIQFSDIIEQNKDSISKLTLEEQEALNLLKGYSLETVMNTEKAKGYINIKGDFEDVNQLNDMQRVFDNANAVHKKKELNSNPLKYEVTYEFKKKYFRRKVTQNQLDSIEEQKYSDLITGYKMFLAGTKYKIVYHFPSKIKSVSIDRAFISNDKKTLTIEYPADSIYLNPYLLDFEVKLK